MSYFIHFSGSNMPKNKLQTAIVDLFKSKSGHIVSDLDTFSADLGSNIDTINATYTKCKPINIFRWPIDDGFAFGCGNEWTCQIYLYKVKEVDNA